MLYKLSEWQGGSGLWYCGCVDNLGKKYQQWMVPVRLLNMTPADFAVMLIEKYNADVWYYKENSFLGWSWKNQKDMRAFKNMINAESKRLNFQIS